MPAMSAMPSATTQIGLPALQQLAYSQEDHGAEHCPAPSGGRYPWRWVVMRAALGVGLAAVLGGGIVVIGHPPHAAELPTPAQTSSPGVPAPAQTATAAPAPPVIPPDIDTKLTGDAWYLSMVNAGLAPIGMNVSDPAGSVDDGHRVCDYIAQGHSIEATDAEVVRGLPATLGPVKANTIARAVVTAAVTAYCPH